MGVLGAEQGFTMPAQGNRRGVRGLWRSFARVGACFCLFRSVGWGRWGGGLTGGEKTAEEINADAAADGGIGNIEGWEMGAMPMEVEKIGDVVEAEAVEEVADNATAKEAEGNAMDAAGGQKLASKKDEGNQHG